jgi:hypothetical protein
LVQKKEGRSGDLPPFCGKLIPQSGKNLPTVGSCPDRQCLERVMVMRGSKCRQEGYLTISILSMGEGNQPGAGAAEGDQRPG